MSSSEQNGSRTMKWRCRNCNYVYDEALGDPKGGVPPRTRWEDKPDDWRCPDCGAPPSDFVPWKH
jgi:rubredoxin